MALATYSVCKRLFIYNLYGFPDFRKPASAASDGLLSAAFPRTSRILMENAKFLYIFVLAFLHRNRCKC